MLKVHFHRKDTVVYSAAQVAANGDVEQQVLRAVKGPRASVAILGVEVFKVNSVIHPDADLVL
jgi:hypothetical protein